MPVSPKDFAQALAQTPADATDDQKLGMVKQILSGQAPTQPEPDAVSKAWEWVNRPIAGSENALVPQLRHTHAEDEGGVRRTAEDFGASLTSPLNVGLTATGVGAGLAGKAGMLGVSKAARMAEGALQAPLVAEGLHSAISPQSSLGERLGGVLEAGMGAHGIQSAATHAFDPEAVVNTFRGEKGISPLPHEPYSLEDSKTVADQFAGLKHAPNDPEVKASYDALKQQIKDQYLFLKDRAGLKMEPNTASYADSPSMRKDVVENNHLNYYPTTAAFGNNTSHPLDHLLLEHDPQTGLSYNDMFRAVHDYFGHASNGSSFGPLGEFKAFQTHRDTFTPDARGAMTTETKAQNSWVNTGEHMRDAEGNIPQRGEPGYVPLAQRPFAEQKNVLLPEFRQPVDVRQVLSGNQPYGILAAGNPMGKAIAPEENAVLHQQLLKDLQAMGANPIEQHGVYGGNPEPSVLVPGLPVNTTKELGRKYAQEAVISHEGWHRLGDDRTFPQSGPAQFDQQASDYYSQLAHDPKLKYQLQFPDEAYAPAESHVAGGSAPTAVQSPSIQLEHRSPVKDLTEIDPARFGSGQAGAESRRKAAYPQDWLDRSYYTKQGGFVEPRFQGLPVHTAELPEAAIYDIGKDPEGFVQKALGMVDGDRQRVPSVAEKLVKEAGYKGYHNSSLGPMGDTVAVFDKLPVKPPMGQGATTALAVAAPAASAAIDDSDPNDPNQELKHYAKLGLNVAGGASALAAAGWFPKRLKAHLDELKAGLYEAQRAEHRAQGGIPSTFMPKDAQVDTAIRNEIHKTATSYAQEKQLQDGYVALQLPKYQGVDFDQRRPLTKVLAYDKPNTSTTSSMPGAKGVKLSEWSAKRMDLAYDAGVERGNADGNQWGSGKWLYHLSNGDPTIGVQATRLLGAFSPGQKTDANAFNMVEGFVRAASGQDPASITRSLFKGHPRPSAVSDNVERAIGLGRIFANKTEALAGAEVGFHEAIPVDMWLLRALGTTTEKTPPDSAYRLISEAVTKAAKARGENPFNYMAKVWMGMQSIAGQETPSFADAVSNLKLPGHLADPQNVASIRNRLPQHAYAVNQAAEAARQGVPHTGAVSPLATNPKMPFEDWLQATQDLMRQGLDKDVLGKKVMGQKKQDVTFGKLLSNEQTAKAQWKPAPKPEPQANPLQQAILGKKTYDDVVPF